MNNFISGAGTFHDWAGYSCLLDTPRRTLQISLALTAFLFFAYIFYRIRKQAIKGDTDNQNKRTISSYFIAGKMPFLVSGALIFFTAWLLPFLLLKIVSGLPIGDLFIILLGLAFISVMGPFLLVGLALTCVGGLTAVYGFIRGPHTMSRAKAFTIALIALIFHAALFQGIWPIKDPAPAALMEYALKYKEVYSYYSRGSRVPYACMCEIFSYGPANTDLILEQLEKKKQREEEDIYILKFAVIMLGFSGKKRAVQPLIKLIGHRNFPICAEAAAALGRLDARTAVEPLLQMLKDDSHYTVANAAMALGRLNEIRAVEPLIDRLKNARGRLANRINSALERLTPADYKGTDENMYQWWHNWWKKNKEACIKKKEEYRL
ncbi:MAG: HEAT repeat domain-containing protein [bacterium]|nr:HEAT repeat domain-containing protein [bacterium]